VGYYFEAERNAGVRTAGILARQSLEIWKRFASPLKTESNKYARGNEFALPMAAHVVVVSKR
jgi:hypothetical protein